MIAYADVISCLRRQQRRKDRPRCGAKTRAGRPCRMRVEFGKARCRLHGGLSTGPKTEAGRARIAEADLTAVFNFIGQRVPDTRVNLRVQN
jgi:hypothetical protein